MTPNLNTFAPTSGKHTSKRSKPFPSIGKQTTVTVIGAGAFGGWAALYLLRKGFKVTLVDAWGPGNSRSSSGDETRVIRSTYGGNETYFDLNVRALELWKENEIRFGKKLFFNSGVLWFCYHENTPVVDDSLTFSIKHGMPYEYLSKQDLNIRFPLISTEGLHHAYMDSYGGYLLARESSRCVQEAFVREGGNYIQQQVRPPDDPQNVKYLVLSTGAHLHTDIYLFACGAWLAELFPNTLDNIITCTKQEVYYFGTPAAHARSFENLPVWVDVDGRDFYYGIPGNHHRGFKIGVDIRGEKFNPTTGEHTLTPEVLHDAREFIGRRFPELQDAPLLEHRVCPYENSPDGNFIFDSLPGTDNIFLLGGGSGHGFKHGPALGELVADAFSGSRQPPEIFSLPT